MARARAVVRKSSPVNRFTVFCPGPWVIPERQRRARATATAISLRWAPFGAALNVSHVFLSLAVFPPQTIPEPSELRHPYVAELPPCGQNTPLHLPCTRSGLLPLIGTFVAIADPLTKAASATAISVRSVRRTFMLCPPIPENAHTRHRPLRQFVLDASVTIRRFRATGGVAQAGWGCHQGLPATRGADRRESRAER